MIASLEQEAPASRTKTPRKLLQLMLLNLRPLDVPSAFGAGTPSSGTTTRDEMLIDDIGANAASSTSACTPAQAVAWLMTAESTSSSVVMESDGHQQSISAPQQQPATSSDPHVIIITPQYELGDASDGGTEDSSLVWISPWDTDDGGLGRPTPFVPVHSNTVSGASASDDSSQQEPAASAMPAVESVESLDTSLFPVRSQHPVVLYHSIE